MNCGIISKAGHLPQGMPIRKNSSGIVNSDSFLIKEQITAEDSLMGKLISKINGAMGANDTLRSTLQRASKKWRKQKSEMAVREKIYKEHECEGYKLG